MNPKELTNDNDLRWFAIRTRHEFRAEEFLTPLCDEVFLPKETFRAAGRKTRIKAFIPHVMFIKTTEQNALSLEKQTRVPGSSPVSFWIYRYPTDNKIQVISQQSINLLRMLSADDTSRCEIFNKTDFKEHDRVRIIGGLYKGYEGYVQRVKKNLHVVVRIEGICAVLLPFIHPDLLTKTE